MGRKKKCRGAKFAEGDRVVNFAPRACEENGGHPPEGTVLRATRKVATGSIRCRWRALTGSPPGTKC